MLCGIVLIMALPFLTAFGLIGLMDILTGRRED